MEHRELSLPLTVVSRVDVARLLRELNALNDFLADAKVRQPGTPMRLPKLTRQLDDIARENQLNLLEEGPRKELYAKLHVALNKAPGLHISFASEPSPKALHQILLWLRRNVHPQVLVQVGLQPTIAAGCVIRSPNLLFDMSMRQYLVKQEPYLTQLIKEAVRAK